jgi:LytS/YehU family sensor histidine kinase
LHAQIEPHVLFNTLATLACLIVSDPPRARELPSITTKASI